MKFPNFPPAKIGTKIQTQNGAAITDAQRDARDLLKADRNARQDRIDEAMSIRGIHGSEFTAPKPMLGENAAEAERLTYAGRRPELLREAKTFDDTKLESMPLFASTAKQGRLL